MLNRLLSVAVMAASLLAVTTAVTAKDTAKTAADVTHDGKLVSMTNNQFVISTKKGKQEANEATLTLASDAKVMLDGKASKLADLKAGMRIRVSTHADDAKTATMVEAIDKNKLFAHTHDGKVVSITSTKLVMTDKDGKEHSHVLSADTKFCCDGEDCKFSDLKSPMKIRVTTNKDEKAALVGIEAIEKDTEFAAL